MRRLLNALRDAADGAVVIAEDKRIIYWNKAAERILDFHGEDITHQFCYHVIHGQDEAGYKICRETCPIAQTALQSNPVENFDMQLSSKQGVKKWLNVSTFVYRDGKTRERKVIVHLFHVLENKAVDERILNHMAELVRQYKNIPDEDGDGRTALALTELTKREKEVLALLAKSCSTREIGDLLSISKNTVRNHVQNILQKFQVHTRLEAVIYAIKNDLIEP